MIRLASFNPILDPWVYLLVRRELRWKVICLFKYIFGISRRPILTTPVGDRECPVFSHRMQRPVTEMSCLSFCFHCLCDPPSQRSSMSLARSNTTRFEITKCSPAYVRRIASVESVLNGASKTCVISQPTPSEEFLLQKFCEFKPEIDKFALNDVSHSQQRTWLRVNQTRFFIHIYKVDYVYILKSDMHKSYLKIDSSQCKLPFHCKQCIWPNSSSLVNVCSLSIPVRNRMVRLRCLRCFQFVSKYRSFEPEFSSLENSGHSCLACSEICFSAPRLQVAEHGHKLKMAVGPRESVRPIRQRCALSSQHPALGLKILVRVMKALQLLKVTPKI